jgi:hypothetical protein
VSRVAFVLIFVCQLASAQKAPAVSDPADITIKQSTVGNLDGARVGVMSIYRDTYELQNGEKKTGLVARLSVAGEKDTRTVGEGSVFTLNEHIYEVVAVEKREPRDTVTIRKQH